MQVKRFKAADMRRALEMVRSDLGDDAVILSNSNHGNYVEVMATADDCTTWLATENERDSQAQSVFSKYEEELDDDCLALLSDMNLDSSKLAHSNDEHKVNLPNEKSKSYYDFSALINANKSSDNHNQQSSGGHDNTAISDNNKRQSQDASDASPKKYEKSYLSEQLDKLERQKQSDALTRKITTKNRNSGSKISEPEAKNDQQPIVFSEDSFFSKIQNEKSRIEKRESVGQRLENLSKTSSKVGSDHAGNSSNDVSREQYHQEIKSLQSELSDMRGMLEQQLVESQQLRLKGSQLTIDRRLSTLGFTTTFRSEVHRDVVYSANDHPSDCWRPVLGHLAKKIKTLSGDLINSGGRLAFIGPTGAGKTTTIAKLATRYVLEHGRESIALVTTDNERLGSQSQLKSLANILQIPMRTAEEPNQLVDVLASLDAYRLVLIDTPGVNIREINENSWFNTLNTLTSVSKIFVTAANVQGEFQKRLIGVAKEAQTFAVVLTKIDECLSLGESLQAIIESQLPMAYVSDGQNIPSDIHLAKATGLLALAVKLGQSKLVASAKINAINGTSELKVV